MPINNTVLRGRCGIYIIFLVILISPVFLLGIWQVVQIHEKRNVRAIILGRQMRLTEWNRYVRLYVKEKGVVPDRIEDIVKVFPEDMPSPYIYTGRPIPMEEQIRLIKDITCLSKTLEYQLVHYRNGWFIMESVTSKSFPYQLIIDQEGRVYSPHPFGCRPNPKQYPI